MINWLGNIKRMLRRPKSKFKLHDCVHLRNSESLMIVIKIHTSFKMERPLIECKWYETGSGHRTNLFPEESLTLFNWESTTKENKKIPISREQLTKVEE